MVGEKPRAADVAGLPVRPLRRLAGGGHEALALLAGRLGEQLLRPEPEPALVRVDADLVAPRSPAFAELQPQLEPGVYRMEVVAYDAVAGTASVRYSTVEKPRTSPDQLRMSSLVLIRRGEKVPQSDRLPGSPLYVGDTLMYPNLGTALKQGVDKELPFYFTAYASEVRDTEPYMALPFQLTRPFAGRHPLWRGSTPD